MPIYKCCEHCIVGSGVYHDEHEEPCTEEDCVEGKQEEDVD